MTTNYYAEILTALAAARVRFVVAGGVAAVMHGVERVTMDIDISLEMTPENLRNFLDVMRSLQMVPRAPVPPEFILDPENIRKIIAEKNALVFTFIDPGIPLKQVDIFLTEDLSFASLSEDADIVRLSDQDVAIASKPKLLELKQKIHPPRAKDILDMEELKKLM